VNLSIPPRSSRGAAREDVLGVSERVAVDMDGGGEKLRPLPTAVAASVPLVSLILWGLAVRRVDVRSMDDVGLIGVLPVPFFVAVALLTAGFVAKLMPGEPIAALIGPESGWRGILVASLTGGFVPAGPIISFPLVVVLYKAGAGIPQIVAFLTAWSVFAFHRVLIYESTLMGWRFSVVRLVSSVILPPLSGLFALGLMRIIPV